MIRGFVLVAEPILLETKELDINERENGVAVCRGNPKKTCCSTFNCNPDGIPPLESIADCRLNAIANGISKNVFQVVGTSKMQLRRRVRPTMEMERKKRRKLELFRQSSNNTSNQVSSFS